jgi:hypothetical protein
LPTALASGRGTGLANVSLTVSSALLSVSAE